MNKEVIYLEPEDDITDILTKLQQAEQKLVALVPPKKATMLRSAVNMKLVAKTAKESDKVAVVVTADPAVMKLAMNAKIPVAKTLQSRPVVPTEESLKASEPSEQVIDEEAGEKNDKKDAKKSEKATGDAESDSKGTDKKKPDEMKLDDESLTEDQKKGKNDKNAQKKDQKNKKVPKLNKKLLVTGGIGVIAIIAVLVWALVFAPAVSIVVAISTSSNNFSHTVNFTTDPAAQDLENDLLFVEQKTYEQKYTTTFDATGKEDHGEKASGSVTATYSFIPKDIASGSIDKSIPKGATLTASNGKTYVTQSAAELSWDGTLSSEICETNSSKKPTTSSQCSLSATIPVVASENGDDYNLEANSKWNKFNEASITNPEAITGGKTNEVTIVSQADVERIREDQLTQNTAAGKEQLFAQIKEEAAKDQKARKAEEETKRPSSNSSDQEQLPLIIEETFRADLGTTETTPAVGQEVKDNARSSANVTISYTVYVIPYDEVYEYVTLKSSLGSDQIIYSLGSPTLERFYGLEEVASLKTTTESGPTVTKKDILEKAKGHKLGEVQAQLRSVNGVSTVNVTPSYFWVHTVPTEDDRITIDLKVEDDA